MSSKYIIDAFDRTLLVSEHLIEHTTLPKLNVDHKRLLESKLKLKILKIQTDLEKIRELPVPTVRQLEDLDNLELSQMMLLWTYDQLVYGKW